MRAYLAVIKDSFREALASRVLWILLVLITLFLLGLCPLAVTDELAAELQRTDIRSGTKFAKNLFEQSNSPEPSPGKHLWPMLSDELRNRISQESAAKGDDDDNDRKSVRTQQDLIGELNELLKEPDFYDEAAWKKYRLKDEARRLADLGISHLSDEELRRFNRLALDAAFSKDIAAVQQSSCQVRYLGFAIGDSLPFDRARVDQGIKTILATVMTFLVGTLGVFVAILVTASIIPQMFEPGAIDLLLSKPVSRSLLFLTKFLGGCAFILLNSTFLIVGLWLIVGLRFHIWSNKLLLCIPVFLFLFAIYYSVSAFSGVVWRNAVISVVMAILFWVVCFAVGTTKNVIEQFFLNPKRLAVVVPAGDSLIALDNSGGTMEWRPDEKEWSPTFASGKPTPPPFAFSIPMIGPIYDSHADQLVAIESTSPGFAGFGGAGKLIVGKRADDWKRVSGVSVPSGTTTISTDRDGHILVAGVSGIYRFEGNPSVEHVPMKVLGVDLAQSKAGKFVAIGPKDTSDWSNPFAADWNVRDDSVAVFSNGKLQRLERDKDGKFAVKKEASIDVDGPALISYSGSTVLLAFGSGEVRIFDADTLEQIDMRKPFGSEKPRHIADSDDGRWFAVLSHNRNLWLYDASTHQPAKTKFAGHGDVSAVAFSRTGALLVADRFGRVLEYEMESGDVVRRIEPKGQMLELIYRYGVNPLYTVFPKPGELDNLVQYLLTDQKTASMSGEEENLRAPRVVMNVWQPVWSNLAFLAVVLCIACFYIERKDF